MGALTDRSAAEYMKHCLKTFNRSNYSKYTGVADFQNRCHMNFCGQCAMDMQNRYCGQVACVQLREMEEEMRLRMKEKQRIIISKKNIADIFNLPCVSQILKRFRDKTIKVVLDLDYVEKTQDDLKSWEKIGFISVAYIGDTLVELENGKWKIEHRK